MPKKAILKREKKWLQKYLGGRFAKFCHRTATPADSLHLPPHFCTKKCHFRRKTASHSQLCTKKCQNRRKVATRHPYCIKKCHFRRKTPPPPQLCTKKYQNRRKVATQHPYCTKKCHFRRKVAGSDIYRPKTICTLQFFCIFVYWLEF